MQESLHSGKMNQFVSSALILLCLVVLYTRLALSQNSTYGIPPLCLLSRTDVVNCNFLTQSTPRPNVNEYGVYSTRTYLRSAGLPTCRIRRRKHQIRKIEILGEDPRLKFIFSPGRNSTPPQDYANNMIVFYNISCPAGHIAFLNFTQIAMEGPVCFEQASNTNRCVDYILVNRGGFGITEICGNTPSEDNMNQLQEGPLDITFRTSNANRFAGFEAVVICFMRQEVNMEGCTRPAAGDNCIDSMDTSGTSANTRKKRDLDDFNNEWKSRLASIKRMRRQTVSREDFLRFEEINVTHGVDVFYENGVITFINSENNMEIREAIKNITLLRTFDANGNIDEFKGVAKNEFGDLMCLPGPGPMKILGQCAYFQTFAVVRVKNLHHVGILKMDAFDQLIQAQLDYTLGRGPMHLGRMRRQIDSEIKVGRDALEAAIRNERACNPILRRLALATIENEDPAVVAELRKQIAGQLCPILPSIPNGIITYGPDDIPDFDIGTVATYQCNTGFFLLGDMTRVCTCVEAGDSRGEFSGLEPSCPELLVQCPELPPISNGNITYIPDDTPDFDIRTVAIYQCDPDFLLVGNIIRECRQDGVFDGEAPVCRILVQCPELPPISNGIVTYIPYDTPDFDIGTVAIYQCDPDFLLVGNIIRVCGQDGVFDGEAPVCQILVQCPELPPILNGNITYAPDDIPDFDIGTVAIYQCDPNFLLVGNIIRVCGQNGVFDGEAPVCQILVQCPELPPISNGIVTYAPYDTPDFDIGTVAIYQCDPDFRLVGNMTMVCEEDEDSRGEFSGVPPVCQELLAVCGPPPNIPNGYPESSTRGTVTYSCNSGYTVSGSATVSCLAGGEWSSQPTCAAVSCCTPPRIGNGYCGTPTRTTYGGTVRYYCNSGYILSGSATVTCLTSGSWGTRPTCLLLVQCPELPPILNGFITYAPDDIPDFDIGTVATYQCNPDFFLVGDITRVCGQDGVFDGEAPTCESPL